jgi:hypothetical protein
VSSTGANDIKSLEVSGLSLWCARNTDGTTLYRYFCNLDYDVPEGGMPWPVEWVFPIAGSGPVFDALGANAFPNGAGDQLRCTSAGECSLAVRR